MAGSFCIKLPVLYMEQQKERRIYMERLHDERIKRVRARMEEAGIDRLIVTDPLSIYYLTDIEVHPGERFWALLMSVGGGLRLFANKLFSLGETSIPVELFDDNADIARVVAPYLLGGVIGVDKTMAARFLLPIMDACGEVDFVVGSDCVDDVRAIKDETEKQLMRRASEINDACMEKLAAFIHEGVTEKECAEYLDSCYAGYAVDGLSFPSNISFGANAADPHHRPDDTVIKEGDCIVIDIGCRKDHYCSDMTRTYFWKKVDPRHAEIYNIVLEANERAEALVKAGVTISRLDDAARDQIASFGYGEYFTHRLGHFIGMEDHEKGDVSSANDKDAEPGMIFSIEPGIYIPGDMGVRIEDLVIVTEDGCEILNHVDKSLRVLGN